MTRACLAVALLTLAGCRLGELVAPTPPKKCYVQLWSRSLDPVTWAVLDSTWVGSIEVPCKDFP